MSLTVEDGTGVTNAVSYVALLKADAHFLALENAEWASAPEGLREAALIRASAYVDFFNYPGSVAKSDQGLKWPRSDACDREGRLLAGLPHALTTAVLELAPGFLNAPQDDPGRVITKEKVGQIEVVYYSDHKKPSFVFRLLSQIGAKSASLTMVRG